MRVGLGTIILALGLVGFIGWVVGPVASFYRPLAHAVPFVGAPGPGSAPAYYLYEILTWLLRLLSDPRVWSFLLGLGAVSAMLESRGY